MTEEIRPKGELLVLLSERKAEFERLPKKRQRLIDAERFVPTLELHSLLSYYLFHGHCEDEFPNGRLLTQGKHIQKE